MTMTVVHDPGQPPPDASFSFELRDGTRVRVRPVRPDDKERIQEELEGLSAESRYRRFMGGKDRLSDEELRYLTELDWSKHQAWIAVDPSREGEPAVGVARCVRLEDEPNVAEPAVAVIDAFQGKGLGTLLLSVLVESALEAGIDTFCGVVLGSNADMLEIFRQLGAHTSRGEADLIVVDLPLPEDMESIPDSPAGRVLKGVAQELVPGLLHPLRRRAPHT
jgi:GNAT superfamily N-acetyltransferase